MSMLTRDVRLTCAWLAEITALSLSFAANLAAVWEGGIASRIAGGATPIILLLAVYLWHVTPRFEDRRLNIAMNIAILAVAAPVAVSSYIHQAQLLQLTNQYNTWVAWFMPLSIDGLTVLAAVVIMAGRLTDRLTADLTDRTDVQEDDAASQTDRPVGVDDRSVSAPEKTSQPVQSVIGRSDRDKRTLARAFAQRNPGVSQRDLSDKFDITKHAASTILADVRKHRLEKVV